MQLLESTVKEFQEVFKQEFEEEISYSKAKAEAQNLLNFFSIITKK